MLLFIPPARSLARSKESRPTHDLISIVPAIATPFHTRLRRPPRPAPNLKSVAFPIEIGARHLLDERAPFAEQGCEFLPSILGHLPVRPQSPFADEVVVDPPVGRVLFVEQFVGAGRVGRVRWWLDGDDETVLVPLGDAVGVVVFLFIRQHGRHVAFQKGQLDVREFDAFGLVAHGEGGDVVGPALVDGELVGLVRLVFPFRDGDGQLPIHAILDKTLAGMLN